MAVDLSIDAGAVAEELRQFISRRVKRAGAQGVVLGLSGGLDSSTAAFLAVEALGRERVWPFLLPYRTSSAPTIEDAELVAKELALDAQVIDVTRQIDAYFETIGERTPLRVGNKVARERMSILYDHAKAKGGVVLGSGNRTERLLGYTTLWGDMACDLAPLGGLFKTQARALARAIGVPDRIVRKTPTADLWPGQTDEGELGISYETADAVLHLLVDRHLGERQIVALGYHQSDVARVRRLLRSSAHKRRLPPAPPRPKGPA